MVPPSPPSRVLSLPRAVSRLGLATRSMAVQLVLDGRVSVDGVVVRDPTRRVDLGSSTISVEGRAAPVPGKAVVLALNKPRGLLVTRSDPEGRKTVFDLLPTDLGLLRCVGRLDATSAGLLLVTDDTLLASRLEDPETAVPRVYRVKVHPRFESGREDAFRLGTTINGQAVRPADVEVESHGPKSSWIRVVLLEGRNREIRRMAAGAGLEVEHLIRIAYGPVSLGDLEPGTWRRLDEEEVAELRK